MQRLRHITVKALLASAAVVAIGVATPAFAQLAPAAQSSVEEAAANSVAPTSPLASAAPPSDSGAVAEIVVTATRRSERLQDVPISVTALTSDALTRQNFRDIIDLPKLVPGLTLNFGSQPENNSINLRGIGTLTTGIAVESDVARVVDGVPVGFQGQAFQGLADIEWIEGLKGPQSTSIGKSAIAGVVNKHRNGTPSNST